MALQLVNGLFAISCRPSFGSLNLAKQKRAIRKDRPPRCLDLDSPSKLSFKTRKGLKQNAFSKNEWPKRFAGTGK